MSRDPVKAILAVECPDCGQVPDARCHVYIGAQTFRMYCEGRIRAAHKREGLDQATVEACAREAQDEMAAQHDPTRQAVVYAIVRRIRALASPTVPVLDLETIRGLMRAAEMIEQRDGGEAWDDKVRTALKTARALIPKETDGPR